MIDLHCHVLPGIDDGPRDLDGAVALARRAAESGVRTIVATPHVDWRHGNTSALIGERVADLTTHLETLGIDVRILPGAELALTRAVELGDEELVRLALAGGSWLLVEAPLGRGSVGVERMLESLSERGHRIVLAHPERCPAFQDDPALLARMVRGGMLSSVTAGSLVGRRGKRIQGLALRFVVDGLAHNVSSDAHDALRRPPGMRAEMNEAGLGALAAWLTEAVPAAILTGEPIPPAPVELPPGPASQRSPKAALTRLLRR